VLLRLLASSLVVLAASPAAALAAPPANDSPDRPGEFETFFSPSGTPRERSAIAEPAEAGSDPGVPRCLGSDSFDRTVWYRVPATAVAREVTVEATGRTTDVVDLAAFVQPGSATNTTEPNACSGEGAAGSEISEDRTTAVSLRIPAQRTVLIQVGRRGPVGSAEDEQAVLSLATSDLSDVPRPAGDNADGAPAASGALIALGGATLTEEDPAQPACPSRGSVWRDLGPAAGRSANVTVDGEEVGTLTLFQGTRPTGENALACVNRERGGSLRLADVAVTPGERLWVRLGTDRPARDATARLLVPAGTSTTLPDGTGTPSPGQTTGSGQTSSSGTGSGGGSGATGSSGTGSSGTGSGVRPGGIAFTCVTRAQGRTSSTRTRVALALAGRSSTARQRNRFKTLPLTVQVFRGQACAVRIDLVGPRNRLYARGTATRLADRRALRLKRVRRLVRGTYRLRVTASAPIGRQRLITSSRPPLRIR